MKRCGACKNRSKKRLRLRLFDVVGGKTSGWLIIHLFSHTALVDFSRNQNTMKASPRTSFQQPRAFTLIELLVVISIIAILAGLSFPAFTAVQNAARKTQAKSDETQIVAAIKAYYTEYGKYPVPGAATSTPDDYWIVADNNSYLIDVLRADGQGWDSPTGSNLNPRRVTFLEVPYAKDANNPRSGICPLSNATKSGNYYDPWGNSYRLRIDWDYDNIIKNPYGQNAGNTTLNTGVIVYSVGKDGQSDADNGYTGNKSSGINLDDVISWQ